MKSSLGQSRPMSVHTASTSCLFPSNGPPASLPSWATSMWPVTQQSKVIVYVRRGFGGGNRPARLSILLRGSRCCVVCPRSCSGVALTRGRGSFHSPSGGPTADSAGCRGAAQRTSGRLRSPPPKLVYSMSVSPRRVTLCDAWSIDRNVRFVSVVSGEDSQRYRQIPIRDKSKWNCTESTLHQRTEWQNRFPTIGCWRFFKTPPWQYYFCFYLINVMLKQKTDKKIMDTVMNGWQWAPQYYIIGIPRSEMLHYRPRHEQVIFKDIF